MPAGCCYIVLLWGRDAAVGMGASTLPLLVALKRRGYIPNGSAVIEVGAQQLDESFLGAKNDIAAIGRFFGITSPPPPGRAATPMCWPERRWRASSGPGSGSVT